MDALSQLPGVIAAALSRPDAQGVLQLVHASSETQAVWAQMREQGVAVEIDARSPLGQGASARAWRSGQIVHVNSVWSDPGLKPWLAMYESFGVRSIAAIPVLDAQGRVQAVLSLYGAYPHQFAASWSQDFLRNLAQRWQALAGRVYAGGGIGVSLEVAQARREALFHGGLQMWVQPVVDLDTGQLRKVEALARLVMPDGVVVGPAGFLPLLGQPEKRRLLLEGLRDGLQSLRTWQSEGLHLNLAVNLPPSLLEDDDLPEQVRSLLDEYGIAPERLTLELLETERLNSANQQKGILELHARGVRLAIDDMGAGYNGLTLLRELPISVLKIDQGLVVGASRDPLRLISLVVSLVRLGRDLRLDVVVEGLETPGLIELARVAGASFGQGFGLARPMPSTQLTEWVRTSPLPELFAQPSLHTALGALTYHWMVVHGHVRRSDLASCPLTAFLALQGASGAELESSHAQFHADEDVARNGEILMQALIAMVLLAPTEN